MESSKRALSWPSLSLNAARVLQAAALVPAKLHLRGVVCVGYMWLHVLGMYWGIC